MAKNGFKTVKNGQKLSIKYLKKKRLTTESLKSEKVKKKIERNDKL